MNQNTLAIVLIAIIGLVLIVGAISGWDLLLENRTSNKLNTRLGNKGTKLFFVILGLLLLTSSYYLYQSKKLDQAATDPVLIQF